MCQLCHINYTKCSLRPEKIHIPQYQIEIILCIYELYICQIFTIESPTTRSQNMWAYFQTDITIVFVLYTVIIAYTIAFYSDRTHNTRFPTMELCFNAVLTSLESLEVQHPPLKYTQIVQKRQNVDNFDFSQEELLINSLEFRVNN